MNRKKTLQSVYQKHLNEVIGVIKTLEPEKIILFGSAAFGKIREESDLDLCVIKKGDRLEIKRQISGLLWDAGYDWDIEPDIHVYDPAIYKDWLARADPFLEEIEKGKVLYAKK